MGMKLPQRFSRHWKWIVRVCSVCLAVLVTLRVLTISMFGTKPDREVAEAYRTLDLDDPISLRSPSISIDNKSTEVAKTENAITAGTAIRTYNLSAIFECHLDAAEDQKKLSAKNKLPLCDCVPIGLKPYAKYMPSNEPLLYSTIQVNSSLASGSWSPADCVSRHRTAVIVPYKDREDHLLTFLYNIHKFLQKQKLTYTVFVAEQVKPNKFNKAKLMNAAFLESKKSSTYDCFIFHDVDLIPEDERNLYTCPSTVRHQGLAVDIHNYTAYWKTIIGGVSVFRREIYEQIDGHSNVFWGWGGEDDNVYHRVVAKHIKVLRPPQDLARYHMIKHKKDDSNPDNHRRFGLRGTQLKGDGLSTIKYKLVAERTKKLYRWLLFDLSD